jgi:hypothetical protein
MTRHAAHDLSAAPWRPFEDVLDRLQEAARAEIASRAFYRQLFAETGGVLGGGGGALWLPREGGDWELVGQWPADGVALPQWSPAERRALVCQAAAQAACRTAPLPGADLPETAQDASPESPQSALPVGPWEQFAAAARLTGPGSQSEASGSALAVLEWFLPTSDDALVRRGRAAFLAAVAAHAAEFQAFEELRRLRASRKLDRERAALASQAFAADSLERAAQVVAVEGSRLAGCERLAVLVHSSGRWRLAAINGSDALPEHSALTRGLEQLMQAVDAWGEPLAVGMELAQAWNEGDRRGAAEDELASLPPQLAAAATSHLDRTQARSLVALVAREGATADAAPPTLGLARHAVGLIAEQFTGVLPPHTGSVLSELAELCVPALGQAAELERLPYRAARRWAALTGAWSRPRAWSRSVAALALAALIAATLTLVERPYYVVAPAEFTPSARSEAFATADGVVAEVLATHGQQVTEGEPLLVLHDAALLRELQAVEGMLATAQQRLAAVQAARLERRAQSESESTGLGLSAQQREAEQQIADAQRQRELLAARVAALTVRSPRDGQVLTRDVRRLLLARPVRRGDALLTIADLKGPWELRAETPQAQIGRVLEAWEQAQRGGQPLRGAYRLPGDVGPLRAAEVTELSAVASVGGDGLLDPPAPFEVRLAPADGTPADARPGMRCDVRIDCGRRSLGYVWFAEVAAVLYRWWQL